MKKMIDELWDGEISPQDTLISDNQEYRELQHRQSKNKAELLEALSDEQKELLEKFCATEIELNGISEREAFTAGFKIAICRCADVYHRAARRRSCRRIYHVPVSDQQINKSRGRFAKKRRNGLFLLH